MDKFQFRTGFTYNINCKSNNKQIKGNLQPLGELAASLYKLMS